MKAAFTLCAMCALLATSARAADIPLTFSGSSGASDFEVTLSDSAYVYVQNQPYRFNFSYQITFGNLEMAPFVGDYPNCYITYESGRYGTGSIQISVTDETQYPYTSQPFLTGAITDASLDAYLWPPCEVTDNTERAITGTFVATSLNTALFGDVDPSTYGGSFALQYFASLASELGRGSNAKLSVTSPAPPGPIPEPSTGMLLLGSGVAGALKKRLWQR